MSAIPQPRQAFLTALYRDTALYGDTDGLIGGPRLYLLSDFDRLKWGYRLIGRPLLYLQRIFTTLYRDTALLRPPYWGPLLYLQRILPPYIGMPPYWGTPTVPP